MGRALLAVSTALVLCIGGFGLVVYLTRVEDRIAVDNLLAEGFSRLVSTAERDRDGTAPLTSVAPFAWDQVLLVAPETPRAAISRELGYEWKGDVNFGVSDTLIFLLRGRVVRFADYRGLGVFRGFARPFARIARRTSSFRVRALEIRPDPRAGRGT